MLTCPPKIATASRGVITYNSKVKWTLIENLYSKTQFKTENSNNTLEYVSSNTGEEIFVCSEKCFLPLNKGARDRLTIQEKKNEKNSVQVNVMDYDRLLPQKVLT